MNQSRGWICSAALILILVTTAPAAAQTQPAAAPPDSAAKAKAASQFVSLYNKWEISPSAAAVYLGTDIRVDASNGDVGTTINAQDDLGLSKVKMQPRIDARWRMGHRHELEGGFQFSERTGEKSIQREIDFADTSFDVGASLKTSLTSNLLFLNYRYAIIAKERTQAGLGLGLGALFFSTKIDALASSGSNSVSYSADKSVTAPVGSLGLYGRFLMGSRWSVETDARLVKLRIDRFHIHYTELNGALRYYVSHKVGLEAGGSGDWVKVNVDPRRHVGDADYGPSSEVKFSLANVRLGFVWVP